MRHVTWGAWRWVTAVALTALSLPAGEVLAAQIGSPIAITVSAQVRARTIFGVQGNTTNNINSVAADPRQIEFKIYDDEDHAGGSPAFMYAPVRTKVNKNWHVLDISTNVRFRLKATVSGEVLGGKSLQQRLYGWNGGFWQNGVKIQDGDTVGQNGTDPSTGQQNDSWRLLHNRSWDVGNGFIGVVPFNYRLEVAGVPEGTYAGTVTYTLESF